MATDKTSRVKGRLELSNLKLNTLLDITNAINENSSKYELFAILNEVLKTDLKIGKFLLYTYSNSWYVSLSENVDQATINEIDLPAIIDQFVEIELLSSSTIAGLQGFDIVVPVYQKERPLAYLLLADFEDEKIEISPIIKHLKFIQTLANIIVVALENKRLNKEYIKQVAVKKELELAQNMQALLFPKQLPNNKELEIQAFYAPHSEVGGDYYDVVELINGSYAICIADVSGKGMPAALLMANFQANLRALLNVTNDLKELIRLTNKKVIESAQYEKFITLFIALYDPNKNRITYLNAGHQPAILIQGDQIQYLKKGCTVLGMFEELPKIETARVTIGNNAKMICYTDGLSELEDANGKQLDTDGIEELIKNTKNLSDINTLIQNKIEELEKGSGIADDVTFLAAEFLR